MGYLTDGPPELKPMIDVIKDFGQYRFDPSDIFTDFIDYTVGCLLLYGDIQKVNELKNKYGDDYSHFSDLFREWALLMSRELNGKREWYDPLGLIYEYLAHSGKKSALGQFFTPEALCDLLSMMTTQKIKLKGKLINDCACGSGRTLLSFNAFNPENYYLAEDLDPICAKMAAINFAIHGLQGQVTCMDTLGQNQWKFCFQVNRLHATAKIPVPHLEKISFDKSWEWKKQFKDKIEKEAPSEIVEYNISNNGQLIMF